MTKWYEDEGDPKLFLENPEYFAWVTLKDWMDTLNGTLDLDRYEMKRRTVRCLRLMEEAKMNSPKV